MKRALFVLMTAVTVSAPVLADQHQSGRHSQAKSELQTPCCVRL